MSLARFENWPQRLAAALESRRATAFAWGRNDCAIFAADMVKAITGKDFAAGFRGTYRSKRKALAMLEANGWASLEALGDHFLPRATERLQRGDVVLYDGRFGPFLGIYWAGQIYGPGAAGVTAWPATPESILQSWSVG